MNILVTGAGGFVGRHLVNALLDVDECEVIALDRSVGSLPADDRVRGIQSNLQDESLLLDLFDGSIDAVVHLAAVPGGSAEADPVLSQQVNVEATLRLIHCAAEQGNCPRFVFASTIGVLGDPLPAGGVDDATPPRPKMIYGMHKRMMEIAMATMSRRGAIDGVTLRLPGIVARPRGPSGMKSAFMSDIFHAMREGSPYTMPVSPAARLWLMSVRRCAGNLAQAIEVHSSRLPENRAVTLPALRVSVEELAAALAAETGTPVDNLSYAADEKLEAAFGAHPELSTPAAERAGMAHDGSIEKLVQNALATLD